MTRSIITKICIGSLYLLLSACGGGTIGSGTQERLYIVSGTVIDSSGKPASAVDVQASSSDDRTLTDENGNFKINAFSVNGGISLELHSASLNTVAVLSGFPSELTDISVIIEVDNINGVVNSVELIKVQEEIPPEDQTPADSITQTYSGKTVTARGKALKAVKITETRSRRDSTSDADGHVSLQTKNGGGNVKFLVRYQKLKGSFTILNVPKNQKVSVSFVLRLTVEEAGIDPGTGAPKRKLNAEITSQQFEN